MRRFQLYLNRYLYATYRISLKPAHPIIHASLPRQFRREVSASNIYPTTKSLHSRDHSPHRCHHHPYYPSLYGHGSADRRSYQFSPNLPIAGDELSTSSQTCKTRTSKVEYPDHHQHDEHEHLRVSRRRQVVGLLVSALTLIECLSDYFFFSIGPATWDNDPFSSYWINTCHH